jgi:hypothetical protein
MSARLGNTRTPDLSEVVKAAIDSQLRDFYVALPGQVVSYNSVTQTVDVKPLLQRAYVDEDGNDDTDELPIVTSVPVMFPKAGGHFLSLPIIAGDNVLLLFCDRSIDLYMSSSGAVSVDPVDFREHDITDAVAIPGFFPTPKAIKDIIATDGVFGKEKGAQVRSKGTTIDVTTAGAVASLGGFVALANLVTAELNKIAVLFNAITGHTHTIPTGTSGPPSAAYTPGSVASTNLKAD